MMDREPLSDDVANALFSIRGALLPFTEAPGTDATGGKVLSITEALMGLTSGLVRIAEGLDNVAEAIRDHE